MIENTHKPIFDPSNITECLERASELNSQVLKTPKLDPKIDLKVLECQELVQNVIQQLENDARFLTNTAVEATQA